MRSSSIANSAILYLFIHGEPITIKKIAEGPYGSYRANVTYLGQTPPNKTFFPEHWTRQQVMEAIQVAFKNAKSRGLLDKSTIDPIIGYFGELKIKMTIKNQVVITAYPII